MGAMASRASNSTTIAAGSGSPARRPPTYNGSTTTTATSPSPNKTVFKCRKCNLLFDSADAASSHEEAEHAHLCGICKALRFRTIEELSNHRRNCGEILIRDSGDSDVDDTESSADGVLPDGPVVSAGEINAGNSGTSSTIANNKGATNGENPSEWLTVWTCDICKTAQFESYGAAVAHEAICAGGGGSGSGVVQQDPLIQPQAQAVEAKTLPLLNSEAPPPSSSVPLLQNEKILFSPILSDSSDSLQYHQISEYHRLVLGSIQLRHHPPAYTIKDSIEIGSLHCQYCSQELFLPNHNGSGIPRRWSIGSIVAELPGIVFAHLSVICKSPEGQERQHLLLKAKQSMQSGGHGTTFVNFLSSFFAENGITLPDRGGIGVLHDDDFMRHPQ